MPATGTPLLASAVRLPEPRARKPSILFQIMDGRLEPDFIPVLIDMQSMAIQSEVEFLTKFAQEIHTAAGLKTRAPAEVLAESANPPDTLHRLVCEAIDRASDSKASPDPHDTARGPLPGAGGSQVVDARGRFASA